MEARSRRQHEEIKRGGSGSAAASAPGLSANGPGRPLTRSLSRSGPFVQSTGENLQL